MTLNRRIGENRLRMKKPVELILQIIFNTMPLLIFNKHSMLSIQIRGKVAGRAPVTIRLSGRKRIFWKDAALNRVDLKGTCSRAGDSRSYVWTSALDAIAFSSDAPAVVASWCYSLSNTTTSGSRAMRCVRRMHLGLFIWAMWKCKLHWLRLKFRTSVFKYLLEDAWALFVKQHLTRLADGLSNAVCLNGEFKVIHSFRLFI